MKKRILSILLAAVMLVSVLPTISAYAGAYNSASSVNYASEHWNDGVGKCATFVSNCLAAGGCSAWSSSVVELRNQLINGGWGTEYLLTENGQSIYDYQNVGKLSAGDPIFFYCSSCGRFVHVAICSGFNSSGKATAYAHNAAWNNVTYIAGFWDAYEHKGSAISVYSFHMNAPAFSYTNITPGDYYIRNVSTGKYLDVFEGVDASGQDIQVYSYHGDINQKYLIAESDETEGYVIKTHLSSSRVVNVYADNVVSGKNVCLWDNVGDASQRWYFEATNGGYIIRNVQNPNCVLDVDSGVYVYVNTYNGSQSQVWALEKVGPCINHTYTDNSDTSCNVCGETAYPGGNTLVQENGIWYHVINRQKVKDTALVSYNGQLFYVKNGVLNRSNTLYKHTDGKWYHVKGGKWVKDTTLVQYNGTWYYVKDGRVDFSGNTLVKYNNEWWYVKGGKLCRDNTLHKFTDGKWYHVNNGKWVKDTTLVQYNGSWYYVKGGKVDFASNTLVKYNSQWYHVNGGKWVKDTTLVKYNGTWYYVKGGKVDFTSDTLFNYNHQWYHVKGGKWVKDTTLVKYNGTWYYVKDGRVSFSYTGRFKYNGITYTVVKGRVV